MVPVLFRAPVRFPLFFPIFCRTTSVGLQGCSTVYVQCGEGNGYTGCEMPAVLRIVLVSRDWGSLSE